MGEAVPRASTAQGSTRPSSSFTITRPSSLNDTSSMVSMFGKQVPSQRATAESYTFEKLDTGRQREAHVFAGSRVDPLYRGTEHQRHHMPITPNPGVYKYNPAMGKQASSKKESSFRFSFGRSERFGYIDRQLKHTRTPGPGEYRA
uniref:Uncharacterized protein n=1 Tax=Haptolina brevifila TaxID=156173 RepID=A0A7S2IYG4_9EUKA|mmetsp:Transcript_73706/g.146583  ORF Transcript_73706/g.146583 Transcript_73706/m.146583 type:complete len:146 (+) Transcript_73706:93-530(+)